MITALEIALLLILIALIGMIIGFLFGKLSCKKQQNSVYIDKNDYCENELIISKILAEDAKEKLDMPDENKEIDYKDSVSLKDNSESDSKSFAAEEKKIEEQDDKEVKPLFLSQPKNGKSDNLCRIKGIGFVIEEKLHNLGIYHFEQIAAWTEEEIKWVDSHLAFSGRILREDWVGQAKKLIDKDKA